MILKLKGLAKKIWKACIVQIYPKEEMIQCVNHQPLKKLDLTRKYFELIKSPNQCQYFNSYLYSQQDSEDFSQRSVQDNTPALRRNINKAQVAPLKITRRVVNSSQKKNLNSDEAEFNFKNLIMKTKVKLMRLAYLAYKRMIGSDKRFIILSKPLKANEGLTIEGKLLKCLLKDSKQSEMQSNVLDKGIKTKLCLRSTSQLKRGV